VAHPAAAVDDDGVTFVLTDRYRRVSGVWLVQEVGLDDVTFVRERTHWWLRVPRPPVNRMEYLFEIEDDNEHRRTVPDPGNPLRAPGAFGEKSVLLFPEYVAPAWLDAPQVDGEYLPFEVDAPALDATVSGLVWSPAGLTGPAPLLVVHDGPEFAGLGGFVSFLASSIAAGALPPLRAALVGPGERNLWYSANPAYADTLVNTVLPNLPAATVRIGVGVSLGALAMLHAHRSHGGAFDGLLLQSGSFFTPELDGQESGFSGFGAVTGFVAALHEAAADGHPVPAVLTCGIVEENLANNKRMEGTLARLGYPVRLTITPDAHNYTAWRDALDPHLTGLISRVVAVHAS
jgi:enterochelin esterase-like enzyme